MADIQAQEAAASSEISLKDAVANAIKSALHDYKGHDHQLNVTIVIEGVTFVDGEYKVTVKLLIVDIDLEREKEIGNSVEDALDRMNAGKDLSDQMNAAVYHKSLYSDDSVVHALEHSIEEFKPEDHITIIAHPHIHSQLQQEIYGQQPHFEPTYDSPSPGLGAGSGGGHHEEER